MQSEKHWDAARLAFLNSIREIVWGFQLSNELSVVISKPERLPHSPHVQSDAKLQQEAWVQRKRGLQKPHCSQGREVV